MKKTKSEHKTFIYHQTKFEPNQMMDKLQNDYLKHLLNPPVKLTTFLYRWEWTPQYEPHSNWTGDYIISAPRRASGIWFTSKWGVFCITIHLSDYLSSDQDVFQQTVAQSPRAQLLYTYLVWFATAIHTFLKTTSPVTNFPWILTKI